MHDFAASAGGGMPPGSTRTTVRPSRACARSTASTEAARSPGATEASAAGGRTATFEASTSEVYSSEVAAQPAVATSAARAAVPSSRSRRERTSKALARAQTWAGTPARRAVSMAKEFVQTPRCSLKSGRGDSASTASAPMRQSARRSPGSGPRGRSSMTISCRCVAKTQGSLLSSSSSIIAAPMAAPSSADVPRPSSSTRTMDRVVHSRRTRATSSISRWYADLPDSGASPRAARAKTPSRCGTSDPLRSGARRPQLERSAAAATLRSRVDLPAVFGPVRNATPPRSRRTSLGTATSEGSQYGTRPTRFIGPSDSSARPQPRSFAAVACSNAAVATSVTHCAAMAASRSWSTTPRQRRFSSSLTVLTAASHASTYALSAKSTASVVRRFGMALRRRSWTS
mmetsp:Transcript_31886/g.110228  ORF Transcript_31886/g.110228 Transcript_31886/m.110228 type:complete len:401 (-) Transcript_31886:1975-3177(-)